MSFAAESVLNQFSQFGSKFGAHSPCNQFSTDPPVIVDEAGKYYGRLVISTTHPERIKNPTLRDWIAGVCAACG